MRPFALFFVLTSSLAFGQSVSLTYRYNESYSVASQINVIAVTAKPPDSGCLFRDYGGDIPSISSVTSQTANLYVYAAGYLNYGDSVSFSRTLLGGGFSAGAVATSAVIGEYVPGAITPSPGWYCAVWAIPPYRSESLNQAGTYQFTVSVARKVSPALGIGEPYTQQFDTHFLTFTVTQTASSAPKIILTPPQIRIDFQRGGPRPRIAARIESTGAPLQWRSTDSVTTAVIFPVTGSGVTPADLDFIQQAYLTDQLPDGERSGEFTFAVVGSDVPEVKWPWVFRQITCSFTLGKSSWSPSPAGDTLQLALTTQSDCQWEVTGLPPWLTASPAKGTGPAKIQFVAAPNKLEPARNVPLQIGLGTVFARFAASQTGTPAPPPSRIPSPPRIVPTRLPLDEIGCDSPQPVTGFASTESVLRAWISADLDAKAKVDVQWKFPDGTTQTVTLVGRATAGRYCQVAETTRVIRGAYSALLKQGSTVLAQTDFRVLGPADPAIDEQGIGDIYGGVWTGELAAGARFVIHGQRLAASAATASGVPLRFDLAGVQVFVNGTAAPLESVSPTAIEAQLPWSMAEKAVSIQVFTNAGRSNIVTVQGRARNPVLAPSGSASEGYVLAVRVSADGKSVDFLTPNNPAKPGDTVYLRASGLGLPVSMPDDGASGNGSNRLQDLPRVRIGNCEAKILDAVLASDATVDAVGVWGLAVQVPAWAAPGDRVPIQLIAGGHVTPAAYLSIRNASLALPELNLGRITAEDDVTEISSANPAASILLHVSGVPDGVIPAVRFSNGADWSVSMDAEIAAPGELRAVVPAYIRGLTDEEAALQVSVTLAIGDKSVTSNAVPLEVLRLPDVRKPPGQLTLKYLEMMENVYLQSSQDLLYIEQAAGTPNATLSLSLTASSQPLEALIRAVSSVVSGESASVALGTVNGTDSVISLDTLRLMDRQIAAILSQTAGASTPAASASSRYKPRGIVRNVLNALNPFNMLDDWANDRPVKTPYARLQETWNAIKQAGAEAMSESVDETVHSMKVAAKVTLLAGAVVAPEAKVLEVVAESETVAMGTQVLGQFAARWMMGQAGVPDEVRREFNREIENKAAEEAFDWAITTGLDLGAEQIATKFDAEGFPYGTQVYNDVLDFSEKSASWLTDHAREMARQSGEDYVESIARQYTPVEISGTFSTPDNSSVATGVLSGSSGTLGEVASAPVYPDGSFSMPIPPGIVQNMQGVIDISARTWNGSGWSFWRSSGQAQAGQQNFDFVSGVDSGCSDNAYACPAN